MVLDAKNYASMPPVAGIIRSMERENLTDPIDGSSVQQWRDRLNQIFVANLLTRPGYFQIRFIGKLDNWKELVRVDQGPGGITIMPSDSLQQKGDRSYLDGVARQNMREPYFSELDQNVDHGKVEDIPTIRIVHPVLAANGEVFGAIVVNANFGILLKEATSSLEDDVAITVLDRNASYMTIANGGTSTLMRLHTSPNWIEPPENKILREAGDARTIVTFDGKIYYVVPPTASEDKRDLSLGFVASIPLDALLTDARERLRHGTGISVLLASVTGLLAYLVGQRITAPLRCMQAEITQHRATNTPIDFPVYSEDEVGKLTKSFADLGNELIRQTARMSAILESTSEGIVTINTEGALCDANRAAVEMFGYPLEELIGAPLNILMPSPEKEAHQSYVEAALRTTVRMDMSPNRLVWAQRKNGTTFPIEVSIGKAVYDGKVHFVGVIYDVTQKNEMFSNQDALIDALKRSNDELDQFAYVASHDLKAPLRVIDNASRWLEEDLEEHLNDDTRESLGLLRNRVQRMERLLDDLLEHSRIGRVSESADLIKGEDLIDELKGLLDIPNGFELQTTDALATVTVPQFPLQTVLLNLISNAFRHHDRPSGHVRVDVNVTDDCYRFIITDDGPGIAPEFHKKIFELFQTLKPRDQLDGSGMGLAMVRKHVDIVGGSIEVNSDGVRGTEFRLTWPRSVDERGVKAA
ncbi:MAG: hypothetical protein CML68_23525 [Rhodobacteraceae bacterium]|nr:hypothetical protein [Paracoccaceae bacterium]